MTTINGLNFHVVLESAVTGKAVESIGKGHQCNRASGRRGETRGTGRAAVHQRSLTPGEEDWPHMDEVTDGKSRGSNIPTGIRRRPNRAGGKQKPILRPEIGGGQKVCKTSRLGNAERGKTSRLR